MDTPLISIIIPTYNRAKLLPKAIQSVLEQTYQNWELIIIDNYSDDGTKEVIESFQDHRISMQVIPRTGSVAASRNLGVRLSQGQWVAFLDSDDWWYPTKLEVVSKYTKDTVDIIYHNLEIFDSLDSLKPYCSTKSRKLKSPFYFDLLLNGNDIALSSVIVRKSVYLKVGGMNESPIFFAVEDYDMWLRISQVTESFVHIPRPLGAYQLHEGNIGKINNFDYLSNALAVHLQNLDEKKLLRFQSLYTYQIARRKYINREFRESTQDLLFVVRFGRAPYVLKSALMILFNLVLRGIIPKSLM